MLGGFAASRFGMWLLPKAWKIVSGLAVAGCIYLGLQLILEKAETRSLRKTVGQRDAQIVVLNRDIAQARTNVTTLRTALDRQNADLKRLSAEGQARLAAAEKKVAAANGEKAKAEKRAADALAYKPKGQTPGDRMLDVDRRFLETLK